ncbi:hypothetical protein EJB05_01210 [Eragrostis curvula]|uniref:Uncharacterized protein n=1 Tax=Eragrostis curvula TaxID=38414 RepID=A0A5J9WP20_9POAL|nr:hypothetical protein EJB05_01210 [Eragrostis curvula]
MARSAASSSSSESYSTGSSSDSGSSSGSDRRRRHRRHRKESSSALKARKDRRSRHKRRRRERRRSPSDDDSYRATPEIVVFSTLAVCNRVFGLPSYGCMAYSSIGVLDCTCKCYFLGENALCGSPCYCYIEVCGSHCSSASSYDSDREASGRSRKHKKSSRSSKKKESEHADGPVQLSKFLGRDKEKEEGVQRSAISGKKIMMKLEKSKEDKVAESKRNELLKFLNASYD